MSVEEVVLANQQKKGLTRSLASAVKKLQLFASKSEDTILESNEETNAVCCIIEAVLMNGIKHSISIKLSSFLGGQSKVHKTLPSFLGLIQAVVHKEMLTDLSELSQIKTDIGICRAWVRMSFNEHVLTNYLSAVLADNKLLRRFYGRVSFMRDPEHPTILLSYLEGLSSLNMKLSCNSSVLNTWSHLSLKHTAFAMSRRHYRADTAGKMRSELPAAAAMCVPHSFRPRHWEDSECGSSTSSQISCPDPTDHRDERILSFDMSINASRASVDRRDFKVTNSSPCEMSRASVLSDPSLGGFESSSNVSSSSDLACVNQSDKYFGFSPVGSLSAAQNVVKREEDNIRANDYCSQKVNFIVGSDQSDSDNSMPLAEDGLVGLTNVSKGSSAQEIRGPFEQENLASTCSLQSENGCRENIQEQSGGSRDDCTEEKVDAIGRQCEPLTEVMTKNVNNEFNNSNEDILEDAAQSTDSQVGAAAPEEGESRNLQQSSLKNGDVPKAGECKNLQQSSLEVGEEGESINLQQSSLEVGEEGECRNLRQNSSEVGEKGESRNLQQSSSEVGEKGECRSLQQSYLEVGEESECRNLQQISFEVGEEGECKNLQQSFLDSKAELESEIPPGKSYLSDLTDIDAYLPEISVTEPLNPIGHSQESVPESSFASLFPVASQEDVLSYDSDVHAQAGGMEPVNGLIGNSLNMVDGWSSTCAEANGIGGEEQISKFLHENGLSYKTYKLSLSHQDLLDSVHEQLEQLADMMFVIRAEQGMPKQNFRCKSCGQPIGFMYGKPKLCSFTAYYYCSECFTDGLSYIPARILHNWDFSLHPVSKEAKLFLDESIVNVLFDIEVVNPSIICHVPEMAEIKKLRSQICCLKAYLFTCQKSSSADFCGRLKGCPFLHEDDDMYTIQDVISTHKGILKGDLQKIVRDGSRHVYSCELCSQKGFFCEVCASQSIIYSFEIDSIFTCKKCLAVYHSSCMSDGKKCPKCCRIKNRSNEDFTVI